MAHRIYDSLKKRKNFMMKFDDAPFDAGELKPGWATPTFDKFFTRTVDTPVLLEQSTTFPMTSLQHNLDDLDVNLELDSQRTAGGASAPLTSNETDPNITGKQLLAQPLQAKSIISDNFIDENIEKDGFMTSWMNLLADAMGPAFELWGVFADSSVTTVAGEGTGYKMTDGLVAQARAISADNSEEANGLSGLVYKNKIGEGILDAVQRYIDQDGDIGNARCVLPPQAYSRLMAEIATTREGDLADAIYQKGDMTTILGVELAQDRVLKQTRNGYDKMKFTAGEYKANGAIVDNMKYGFIGQPANVVFGMMKSIEQKNQWDIEVLGYKVAQLVKGDAKIHYNQDTLVIPITMNDKT